MSGHSKWSKVKHQKATTDAAKSAAFTRASRAITIAVKEGGGITDPNGNFKLRLAIEKAHLVNMPKDNIARAIARGRGGEGQSMFSETYEGYGPHGVAILIDAVTDNKQRTVASIKQILSRAGGSMTSPGAVSFLFSRMGVITVSKGEREQSDLFERACQVGASDFKEKDDVFEIYTNPTDLYRVKEAMEKQGIAIDNASLVMQPTVTVSLPANSFQEVSACVEKLEELDDIQEVYTNAEV